MTEATGGLVDKVALITGAAGGLGAAIAQRFATEGAVVGLADLPSSALTETAGRIGRGCIIVPFDVTDEEAVAGGIASFFDEAGALDIVVTSAGVQLHGADSAVDTLDLVTWKRTIDVNLTGVFLTLKYGVAAMLSAGSGGSVINIGSPTGITGCGAGYDAYSASKGGVMALTRAMALDYAEMRIRVNTIVPGTTRTPLIEDLTRDRETLEALERGTPLGRLMEPVEVAGLAAFLASDDARFVTGATLCVDGGLTIR